MKLRSIRSTDSTRLFRYACDRSTILVVTDYKIAIRLTGEQFYVAKLKETKRIIQDSLNCSYLVDFVFIISPCILCDFNFNSEACTRACNIPFNTLLSRKIEKFKCQTIHLLFVRVRWKYIQRNYTKLIKRKLRKEKCKCNEAQMDVLIYYQTNYYPLIVFW